MNIREFEDSDLDAVLSVNMKAFTGIHESFREILGDQIFARVYPDWRKSNEEYIRSLVESEDAKNILVAEEKGEVVGFVHFSINTETKNGQIGLNAVSPSHQGKGFGKLLYHSAMERMKELGVTLVVVGTGGDESHIPARRAYESCGFVRLPLTRYYKLL